MKNLLQRTLPAALIAAACAQAPSEVYVPGPSFSQSIAIRTAQGERATVRVGEPLVLHAERRSGPWVSVRREGLPAGSCWTASPPPAVEPEVAANLRWRVDPPGAGTFNIDFRHDLTREVRFPAPGVYALTARSAALCGEAYDGNTLTVEVVGE